MSIAEKLITIAENLLKVYDAGQQANGDKFWADTLQNGKRTNFEGAFCGFGWNENTFNPRFDMKPTNAYMMFRHFAKGQDQSVDLTEILQKCDVELDFSNATDVRYCFYNCNINHIGTTDFSSVLQLRDVFTNSFKLKKIDKIILRDGATFGNCFYALYDLEEVSFEGAISNDFAIAQSPNLTDETIQNIIDCLAFVSSPKTLSVNQEIIKRLSDEQIMQIANKGWTIG